MSIGDWLYYKKKYKLFRFYFPKLNRKTKNILALTYEGAWDISKPWHITYHSIRSKFKLITKPDLVIEREFNDGKAEYSKLYMTIFKDVCKAFWFIDAHVADINRIQYCNNFDFVFVAQSPFLELVKKNTSCKNVFWLPLCFPKPAKDITANIEAKKIPLSFIGLHNTAYKKRKAMIEFLKNEYGEKFLATTNYKQPKKLVQSSSITTNCSLNNDLNFRVFECLGYGTELITDHVPDINKITGLPEQLYTFKNLPELKNHADDFFNNVPGKKHNMVSVQEWIKSKHTLGNRINEMIQMIETGKQIEY